MSNAIAKVRENRIGKLIFQIIGMSIGAAIYACGVGSFLDPNALAPGGVSGVSVILSKITPVQTGTWVFLLNIPIMLLGIWKFGLKFILSTLYCTFLSSQLMNVFYKLPAVTLEPILAAVAGGTVLAIGLGIVLKSGGTTGGTDILVKVLRTKYPYMKTGNLILAFDAFVLAFAAIALGDIDKALYAGVAVFVEAVVLDVVLYGRDEAKMIYIISDASDRIAKRLLDELDAGVTYVRGMGAYSGKEKNVILCVVKKPVAPKAENVVKEEDPHAFLIVTNATEIFGEGYKNLFGEKL